GLYRPDGGDPSRAKTDRKGTVPRDSPRPRAPGTVPLGDRPLPLFLQGRAGAPFSASMRFLASAASSPLHALLTTSSTGTSPWPPFWVVLTSRIASTAFMPATTLPNTAYPAPSRGVSSTSLSLTLMKNWAVAESGWLPSRAIAIVPRLFLRPFFHSLTMV